MSLAEAVAMEDVKKMILDDMIACGKVSRV